MSRQAGHSQPDFLVIGGMKCASTTMHYDLSCHPQVECGKKEFSALKLPTTQAALEAYGTIFRTAGEDQLLGEVSTAYSMLPNSAGVAGKARKINPDMKIIYLVRDPLKRTISHHQHMINWSGEGQMDPDINMAVEHHPELIGYSRYAMQLQPWVESFGIRNILVLRFEDYVSQRNNVANQVFRFLDLAEFDIPLLDSGLNRGETRRYAGRFILKLYRTSLFRNLVQPLAPAGFKHTLRKLLLRKATATRIAPTEQTVDRILAGVRDDARELQMLLDRDQPLWDLENSRAEVIARNHRETA